MSRDVHAGKSHRLRRGPKKTAILVAQRIVREISEKQLEVGDALPLEKEMLEDYDVGRGTLREALRYLELEGVLSIRPGRGGGPVVSAPSSQNLASTLALLVQFDGATFRSVLETRHHLEPVTARLSAQFATSDLTEELNDSAERMRVLRGNIRGFMVENRSFHDSVAWGSHNPFLGYFINSLHWITAGAVSGIQYGTEIQSVIATDHDRIAKAIASEDPDQAETAMRDHISVIIDYFSEKHRDLLDLELTWDLIS